MGFVQVVLYLVDNCKARYTGYKVICSLSSINQFSCYTMTSPAFLLSATSFYIVPIEIRPFPSPETQVHTES